MSLRRRLPDAGCVHCAPVRCVVRRARGLLSHRKPPTRRLRCRVARVMFEHVFEAGLRRPLSYTTAAFLYR